MSLFGTNQVTIWQIMGILFLFGFFYNLLINWMERNGYDEVYLALLVIIGVGVTLVAYSFIDVVPAIEMALAFAASGFWMVAARPGAATSAGSLAEHEMTKAREWPNVALVQRNQAAEAAMEGIRLLRPLVDGLQLDRTEVLRRQAQALTLMQRIAWLMTSAGAPLRPEDLG